MELRTTMERTRKRSCREGYVPVNATRDREYAYRLRKEYPGLTNEFVAEYLGVSKNYLIKWLAGIFLSVPAEKAEAMQNLEQELRNGLSRRINPGLVPFAPENTAQLQQLIDDCRVELKYNKTRLARELGFDSARRMTDLLDKASTAYIPKEVADKIAEFRQRLEKGVLEPAQSVRMLKKSFAVDKKNLHQLIDALRERFQLTLGDVGKLSGIGFVRLRNLIYVPDHAGITIDEAESLYNTWGRCEQPDEETCSVLNRKRKSKTRSTIDAE